MFADMRPAAFAEEGHLAVADKRPAVFADMRPVVVAATKSVASANKEYGFVQTRNFRNE